MKLFQKIFLIAALAFHLASAHAAKTTFEQANRDFAEGDYRGAIEKYETVFREKGISANLLFNLANAQYRAGHLGAAVLDYKRALLLDPRHPGALANLKIAQNTRGLYFFDEPWWEKAVGILSWDEWAWLSFGALLLLCASVAVRFVYGPESWRRRLKIVDLAMITLLLAATLGIGAHGLKKDRAVAVSGNAVARISPFENADIAFPVAEGGLLSSHQIHGSFVYVRNHAGKGGWVPRKQVEKIIPVDY